MQTECIGTGENPDGKATYIIPRPSQGHVIIGGTYQKNNWDTSVNFETAREIWDRAVEFLPALKSDKSRIISHNVGLRPAREGGPRIELQKVRLPFVSDLMHGVKGTISEERELPIIHAYGFGYVTYMRAYFIFMSTDVVILQRYGIPGFVGFRRGGCESAGINLGLYARQVVKYVKYVRTMRINDVQEANSNRLELATRSHAVTCKRVVYAYLSIVRPLRRSVRMFEFLRRQHRLAFGHPTLLRLFYREDCTWIPYFTTYF